MPFTTKLAFLAWCALCALKPSSIAAVGGECTFRPTGARGTYDLTRLRRSTNYKIEVPESPKVYLLNFCGTLADDDSRKKYSCDARASACEGKVGGSGIGLKLGTAKDSTIKAMDSVVKYTFYDGDSCPSQKSSNLKTIVVLTCSDEKNADAAPIFNREENCEYTFKMKTPAACLIPDKNNDPATPSVKCTTSTPQGDTYDLTDLARQKTDWFVTSPETDYQWYLNLCHDINDVSADKCRSGSSACVTKRSDPTYWKSIGKTSDTQLVFSEEKGLSVVMNGGETCRGEHYRVVIDFVCTPDSTNMGKPIYTDDDPEDCVHQFTWMSRYGCPSRPTQSSCDSGAGSDFVDLAPLRRNGEGMNWEIQIRDFTYYLNVCGPLQPSSITSKCTTGSAICRVKESGSVVEATSLGSHGTLTNAGGVTMYQFEDGDFCTDQARHRTYIHMSCNEKIGKGKPEVVATFDGCLTMMEWETSYACPKKTIGFWSIFLWTSFCLSVAYLVLGIAYKRFVLGLRGFDQIPHVHLWRKAWSKVSRSHEYNIVL